MAISEAHALAGVVTQLVNVVRDLGNSYFRADAAWEEFPLREKFLQLSHEELVKKLETYGLGQDTSPSLVGAVRELTNLLDSLVAKLEKKRAKSRACARIRYIGCGMLFIESVDAYLRVAEGAYTKISDFLNSQLQDDNVWREIATRQPIRLHFSDDERYVSLHISEAKLCSALKEAETNRAVVVLCGGPGKGKSTLVRQLCLQYRHGNSKFQIVMLECGPNIDVAAKKMELLVNLGGYVPQEPFGDHQFSVLKGLESRLSNSKLLVILDDLWEGELIADLVNVAPAGSGAKWLVTSQRKSICASLNRKCITYEIEDLSQDDARRILASHAGFEDQNIPPHLQDVADEIIEKAEANPLVMATLGASIAHAGREKSEVWESVSDNLFIRLDRGPLSNVHGIKYPRSFLETMRRSIDFLKHDQKQLLVLISMCRNPSIPKPALQFLYNVGISRENFDFLDFATFCNNLETGHLLKENEIELMSIHSLTKGFILDQMKDSVKAVENLLNEASFGLKGKALNPIQASVTRVLADLFIDAKFRSRTTAMQTDLPSDRLRSNETQPDGSTMEFKRTTTESIMKLLVLKPRPRNGWTEELSVCVYEVLVEFVDRDCLHQKSMSKLLGSSHSVLPGLIFLKNVCLLGQSFWEGNCIGCNSSIPQALLYILRDSSCAESQNQAASVIADLCWSHVETSDAFANSADMLPQLAQFLSQAHNSDLQKYAARVLAACAYWDYYNHGTVVQKIVAENGLVNSLVSLLAIDENPSVQDVVGLALANLATANPNVEENGVSQQEALDSYISDHKAMVPGSHRYELAQWPGLLEVLVKSLRKTENPVLQTRASSSLANLANADDTATLECLLNHSGLVDNLVSTLYEDQNCDLQEQSAKAIEMLAAYRAGSLFREKLLRWSGLVEGLVNSLLKARNPSLQMYAAKAIDNLLFRIEKDTAKRVVAEHPGLVNNLVQLLDESQSSSVHAAAPAVATLCSLTDVGDDNLRAIVVSSPALLAKLTQSILTGEDRKFEADVVCLVANLAVTREAAILDKIVESPGLVDKLVKSLAEDQSSSLQVNALNALLNLAGEENNKTFDISCFPAFLQRLKVTLLQSKHVVLRETTIMSLSNLIARKDKATVAGGTGADTREQLHNFITGLTKE